MIGKTISHYRVLEKLGEGGMGVVYTAEDVKLDRPVALKFLPAHLMGNQDVRKRFEREAKASAALSHPNVCRVYEIDEAEGKTFLAMEFVEGESLDKKIAQGPLKLDDALSIAQQMATGLEAAHKRGIVHRDIKPENIMVGDDGHVTIMDFGLAQLTEASRLTRTDETLGTVAYMSPEQTEGSGTDHRTDIWSLGVVLYEMITGQQPFKGDYDKAVMYSILNEQPEPPTALRTGVPMQLERLIGKCLSKDPAQRYQSARELTVDLASLRSEGKGELATTQVDPIGRTPCPEGSTGLHTVRVWQRLFGLVALALLAVLAARFSEAPPQRPVTRFSLTPDGLQAQRFGVQAISPDGRHVLYLAQRNGKNSLWVHSLSDETVREVPGTERAMGGFWSPDSSSIGFVAGGAKLEVKRASLNGGNAMTLCELPFTTESPFIGGTWSPDGETIVVSSSFRLFELPARGGAPHRLFDRTEGAAIPPAAGPYILPADSGPAALLYTATAGPNDLDLVVVNLETGEHRDLGPGGFPSYSRNGYIVHGPSTLHARGLWARPFSRETLEPKGEAFPISADGYAPSVSDQGELVYLDDAIATELDTLVWRSRLGDKIENLGQPLIHMRHPALSPDGYQIAVNSNQSGGGQDVWVHDLAGSTTTRLTFDERPEYWPTWSPSGREIAYGVGLGGEALALMKTPSNGTGKAVTLTESAFQLSKPDWSRDGRYLVYQEEHPQSTRNDIRYLELQDDDGPSEPLAFLASAADESEPRLSPSGRFLAYASDESGRSEIYVRPFPSGEGKWQVSVNGGARPRWRPKDGELYYVERSTLMAVSVSTENGFTFGRPRALFESPDVVEGYDVSADGERFAMVTPVEEGAGTAPPKIRVVQNWYEEFRDREQD